MSAPPQTPPVRLGSLATFDDLPVRQGRDTMRLRRTKIATSDEATEPAIEDLRRSVRRLRFLTASLFALALLSNVTPVAAEIKAKITGEDVVDGSLTGADVQDRSLTGVDVAGSSIDGFNVALDTLVGGHVEDDSLTTLDVQDGSLAGADVQDGSLTGADVQDGSLSGADVAPSSLNGSDILDNSLTGSDIDESALANNDAHDFFNPECDPHSGTPIECGTLTFTLGHPMPVIAFWNYAFKAEIPGDRADGACQTRVDGATTAEVHNETYDDQPDEFQVTGGDYGATPIVDVLQLTGGSHTIGLWCSEFDPDDKDFVVTDLRMAVVELGID